MNQNGENRVNQSTLAKICGLLNWQRVAVLSWMVYRCKYIREQLFVLFYFLLIFFIFEFVAKHVQRATKNIFLVSFKFLDHFNYFKLKSIINDSNFYDTKLFFIYTYIINAKKNLWRSYVSNVFHILATIFLFPYFLFHQIAETRMP